MTPIPDPVLERLEQTLRERWSGREEPPPRPPGELDEGVVTRLAGGGPFGWHMDGRLDRENGRLVLEVLENSRMAGQERYRVWEDGTVEPLAAEWGEYIVGREAEWAAHNDAVQRELRERGFA